MAVVDVDCVSVNSASHSTCSAFVGLGTGMAADAVQAGSMVFVPGLIVTVVKVVHSLLVCQAVVLYADENSLLEVTEAGSFTELPYPRPKQIARVVKKRYDFSAIWDVAVDG